MKSLVAILVCLSGFSLAASAMPHASLNQLVQQSDPNCTQSGGDNGFKDLIQQVNLFSRQNPNPDLQAKYPNEPRGSLREMAGYLNLRDQKLSKRESRLRELVGDFVCPGVSFSKQGTATLISTDGTLLTSAHLMLSDHGVDIEAMSTCFWQRKGSNEKFYVDASTFKPLTRDISNEFSRDLAVVKLRNVPHLSQDVRPAKIDDSNERLKPGDQYLMISATQEGVPSLLKEPPPNAKAVKGVKDWYINDIIKTPTGDVKYTHSSDLIAQSCTMIEYDSGIYGNCSAVNRSSGSAIVILRGDEIILTGVHRAGGLPKADHTPFTRDSRAPGGKSYSYEVPLNSNIVEEIESLVASNDKGRSSLGEQRASIDSK